jgi:hypothetical protein
VASQELRLNINRVISIFKHIYNLTPYQAVYFHLEQCMLPS